MKYSKKITILIIVSILVSVGYILFFDSPEHPVQNLSPEQQEQNTIGYESHDGSYALFVNKKELPQLYFFGEDIETSPHVIVSEDITVVDVLVQEEHNFNVFEMTPDEVFDSVRNIPVSVQFSLRTRILGWSSDDKMVWGAIHLIYSADPPSPDTTSLFEISTDDWSVREIFLTDAAVNFFGPEQFNTENGKILYEEIGSSSGLKLNIYDTATREITTIVSYASDILSEYLLEEYIVTSYFYGGSPGGWGDESRQLGSKWETANKVSYIDFITRKMVVIDISN